MTLQFLVQVPPPLQANSKSNYISTTKYNMFSFIPISLIIQFRRYANVYFLVSAILQCIPLISPLSPFSAVAPLVFVLCLSMAREGFEDYKRWKSDQSDNSQLTLSYKDKLFGCCTWKQLHVGEIIKIQKDEIIPADVLILISSSSSGISYVQTSSLDGEKNLKPKFSVAPLQQKHNSQEIMPEWDNLAGTVRCINPSAEIQAFEGEFQLKLKELPIKQKINKKNMLLRGCKLKNTDWVVGLIIYTGEETAIMMNGSRPFTKISNIQRRVNNIILIVFAFELLCSLGSALFCYFQCKSGYNFQLLVMGGVTSCSRTAGISFGSYFILYSTFIPISLIVSLEFVKVLQGFLMTVDKQMFCAINQRALECHTVSINEQLGQVDYILTDKTGTLTCNKMEFRNIVIGDDMYGENISMQPFGDNINYERLSSRFIKPVQIKQESFRDRTLTYNLSFDQHKIQERESGKQSGKEGKRQLIQLMFTIIATCHECVPSSKGGYEGPSPDEVSLVNAAAKVGFKFVSCQNKIITVQYRNKKSRYQILKLIEFDSDRKRMTVVLKTSKGISIFVKGADSSLQKLLSPNQKYLKTIRDKTFEMSRTGLRSLWFAYKTYPLETDIESLSVEQIEKDLTLIGATGIQDKLQDFVAETIYSLRSGGIKFIMLTGDKLETAENIALSCRLIEKGELIKNAKDLDSFAKQLQQNGISFFDDSASISPVIDGSCLSFAQCEANLLIILKKTNSAVFCRVTPKQKAEIVRLVKKLGKLTLAIGDGANDVNMIMEAHVGVGIFGEEGTRAAQVANYAIGEFCLLWKLLLYYGRLNYMRITEMILYFFYKNMVFTSVQFAYSFYNRGSGQSFWLSWAITFYNMIFTLFPVVIRAIFEVDLELKPTKQTFQALSKGTHSKQTLYSYYPKMYYVSQKNKLFTKLIFFSWFFLGFFQGIICLILTVYAIGDQYDSSGSNSFAPGFYLSGISAYTSVVIVVTIKLAVNVKHWTLALVIGFVIPSICAYIGFTFVLGAFEDSVTYEIMIDLLTMPTFYVIQFLCIGGMFAFDFLLFSLQATKSNFVNYLKYKTLKDQRLSESNLNKFMLQMVSTDSRKVSM